MGTRVPYLLFGLEGYDRPAQSIRTVGGVLIAMESPVYVGRLLLGSDAVADKSHLVVAGRPADRLYRELQTIGERPGADVTQDSEELWALFSDPEITDRGIKAVFLRNDQGTSFVRRTDRYEQILREFVQELATREGASRQA